MTPDRTAISNAIDRLKILSEPCLPESNARQLHHAADDAIATIVVSEVSTITYRLGKLRVVIGSAEYWRDTLANEQQRRDIDQAIEDLRLAKREYTNAAQ